MPKFVKWSDFPPPINRIRQQIKARQPMRHRYSPLELANFVMGKVQVGFGHSFVALPLGAFMSAMPIAKTPAQSQVIL